MKKKAFLLLCSILSLVLLSTFVFSGCATNAAGDKVLNPYFATNAAPVLNSAVGGAVIFAYTKDTNTAVYCRAIRTALYEFLLSEDLSGAALQAKLYALPIPAMKTAEAQLIMTPLLGAYKGFADRYVKSGIKRDPGLVLLVQALIDGIDQGLSGIGVIQSGSQSPSAQLEPRDIQPMSDVFRAMAKEVERHRAS